MTNKQQCSERRQRFRTWILRATVGCLCLGFGLTGTVGYYANHLPNHFYLAENEPPNLAAWLPMTVAGSEDTIPTLRAAEVRLFGIFPIKTISFTTVEPITVFLGGEPFGIRMLMAGVMVVSVGEVTTADGSCSPAKTAGIAVGDVIQSVGGQSVTGNPDLQAAVAQSAGEAVSVTLLRNGTRQTVSVVPAYSSVHDCWQTGMWVRDSTAGIGTVTYYTAAENGTVGFAGLGHAVCDADTGEQIPLASGEVSPVSITDVQAGQPGVPGELRGRFEPAKTIGTLLANTGSGVYGRMDALPAPKEPLVMGFRQDVTIGKATIFSTLDGQTPCAYDIEIEEIHQADTGTRNLVVHVTDSRLLAATGGIVQGMSGSPIVQNGKLIGAVTHVFVRDPTRGYGIFAENMYTQTAAQQAVSGR